MCENAPKHDPRLKEAHVVDYIGECFFARGVTFRAKRDPFNTRNIFILSVLCEIHPQGQCSERFHTFKRSGAWSDAEETQKVTSVVCAHSSVAGLRLRTIRSSVRKRRRARPLLQSRRNQDDRRSADCQRLAMNGVGEFHHRAPKISGPILGHDGGRIPCRRPFRLTSAGPPLAASRLPAYKSTPPRLSLCGEGQDAGGCNGLLSRQALLVCGRRRDRRGDCCSDMDAQRKRGASSLGGDKRACDAASSPRNAGASSPGKAVSARHGTVTLQSCVQRSASP